MMHLIRQYVAQKFIVKSLVDDSEGAVPAIADDIAQPIPPGACDRKNKMSVKNGLWFAFPLVSVLSL